MAAQLGQGTIVHIYRQEVGPPHKVPNLPNTHSPWAPITISSLTLRRSEDMYLETHLWKLQVAMFQKLPKKAIDECSIVQLCLVCRFHL
jgi:hypothetical protein